MAMNPQISSSDYFRLFQLIVLAVRPKSSHQVHIKSYSLTFICGGWLYSPRWLHPHSTSTLHPGVSVFVGVKQLDIFKEVLGYFLALFVAITTAFFFFFFWERSWKQFPDVIWRPKQVFKTKTTSFFSNPNQVCFGHKQTQTSLKLQHKEIWFAEL